MRRLLWMPVLAAAVLASATCGSSSDSPSQPTPTPTPCTFQLTSAASADYWTPGGAGKLTVTTGANCSWFVDVNSPTDDWVKLTAGGTKTGPGEQAYTVLSASASPVAPLPRTGTISVYKAGTNEKLASVTLTQKACSFTLLSPISAVYGANGGTGVVSISTGSDCEWWVDTNSTADDFVKPDMSKKKGTMTLSYTVKSIAAAPIPALPRSGLIWVETPYVNHSVASVAIKQQ